MSTPTTSPSRHEVGQENKPMRIGSRYCLDLSWLVERDYTVPRRGSSASVFSGMLLPEGRKVAIKTLHCAVLQDGDSQVLQEIYLWCQLRHRNILPLLGITTAFGNTISTVSPWMDSNAYQYVQDCTIDPRPLLLGIAKGLHYLHDHRPPVYHGDVKGVNILISNDGQPLLGDFGLSHVADSPFDSGTRSGFTLRWAAPECLKGGRLVATPEADVWAFGMTALELFIRKVPFHGRSDSGVVARIFTERLPDRPSEQCTYSRLTQRWWQRCSSCWKDEPSLRPSMMKIVEMIFDAQSHVDTY